MLAEYAEGLKQAGLKRVNISLDSLREDRYRQITGGDLKNVIKGMSAAVRVGLSPIKINIVLILSLIHIYRATLYPALSCLRWCSSLFWI